MPKKMFDLFLPYGESLDIELLERVAGSECVGNVYVWCPDADAVADLPGDITAITVSSLSDTALYAQMAQLANSPFVVCLLKEVSPLPAVESMAKMCDAMEQGSAMLYCDYYKEVDGECNESPTIEYHAGSLRNDFDFGSVVAMRTLALKEYLALDLPYSNYAGFYQLRLALSRIGALQHLPEYLYTEKELDTRKSGEKQFDYVNPAQREVQIEMETVCTDHLKRIGGWLPPYKYSNIDLSIGEFPVEASVVIPVLNRASTISDAIRSVLAQQCSFKFNILVVDNHSTDGTSDIIDSFDDERVCHIIPERNNLGIGGCWNLAVNSEMCGRFAVQLDSDDLYSDENTLQKVVDEFYRQQCAMLIGSYRICNFELETLPPGIIDHREWTEENGRNNALRINGLGAPRAFFTPVVREVGFPNVSYGEDYAVGLQISRNYRIGRIYDVLYLCRRWDGNSDAALSHAKVNAHNIYKDSLRKAELEARIEMLRSVERPSLEQMQNFFAEQLSVWPLAAERFEALGGVQTRELECGITLQYNPARMVSTAAKVDKINIEARPCFLCAANRPQEQISLEALFDMEVLVNPFPILPGHLTLPMKQHTPQLISPMYNDMLSLARLWQGMAIFYNGAKCGASAPDHAHLQAVRCADVPLLGSRWSDELFGNMQPVLFDGDAAIYIADSYIVPLFVIDAADATASARLFARLTDAMPVVEGESEPRMNILSFYRQQEGWVTVIFPRKEHRPACYYAEDESLRLVSPGLLDMAALMITPRCSDFESITDDEALAILNEVSLDGDAVSGIVEALQG